MGNRRRRDAAFVRRADGREPVTEGPVPGPLPLDTARGDPEALEGSKGPRWLARLAESRDTPRRTAAAFALGVFLSFSPFLGLQIVTGLTLAIALRLSRVATLVGLCVNL